jgi:uncharacterized protein YjbJ (UPF0337 family)
MKDSTKDRVKGTMREAKGKLKEAVGVVTDNRHLKNRGRAEQLGGKKKKKVGQVERTLGD